jgi:hypothetical protein
MSRWEKAAIALTVVLGSIAYIMFCIQVLEATE